MMGLPIDVYNHILEYNPQHRKHMNKCLEQIKLEACMKLLRTRTNSIENILSSINDPEYMLGCLSKCDCCYRHSILRPSHLNCREYACFTRGECYPRSIEEFVCECKCRHYCRIIHQAFS